MITWGVATQVCMIAGPLFRSLPTKTCFNAGSVWGISIYLAHEYARARRIVDDTNTRLSDRNPDVETRIASRTESLERS